MWHTKGGDGKPYIQHGHLLHFDQLEALARSCLPGADRSISVLELGESLHNYNEPHPPTSYSGH